MDTITHTVLGACLGEAIAGKQMGKKAMLFGILANNLPDIDVISASWTTQAEELLAHRGITHSILFSLIFSPLLAYAFQKMSKNNSVSFKRWLVLIGSGLFLHIIMDSFTAYGTGWFEPFNHTRVSFNTLFILDPFFSIPILITAIALWIMRRDSYTKRKWFNVIGLSISSLYLLITFIIKLYVNSVIEKDLSAKNITYTSYLATPGPLNNLLWYSVVKNHDHYYIGYYSVLDKNPTLNWELFQKNDSLLAPFKNSEDVQYLMRFSKDYYRITKQDSLTVFSDMRFGSVGGWQVKQAPSVFNFNITRTSTGEIKVEQAEFEELDGNAITMLIDRVKGI
jgi:inner membrane protein